MDRYVVASLFASGEGDFTDARTALREMLEAPLLRAPGEKGLTREEYELRQELGIA